MTREDWGVVLGILAMLLFAGHVVLVILNWSAFWHLIGTPSGQLWWAIWLLVMSDVCEIRSLKWAPKFLGPKTGGGT